MYQNYYKYLKKFTIKTTFIEINKELIDYFLDENEIIEDRYYYNNSDDYKINLLKGEKNYLNDLIEKINNLLKENKYIFVKVNDIAAKDIDSFVPKMKIEFIDEFLLYMKYSNRISNELEGKNNSILQIKKFYEFDPAMEFRIFLNKGKIIGISQRFLEFKFDKYTNEFFNILKQKANELVNYKNVFENLTLTIDIYIDMPPNYKLKIIDINSENSDLLLFNDEDIKNTILSDTNEYEIKYIKTKDEIREKPIEGSLPLEFEDMNEIYKNAEESLNLLNLN